MRWVGHLFIGYESAGGKKISALSQEELPPETFLILAV